MPVSEVLKAIKVPYEYLNGSIRISLGKNNNKEENIKEENAKVVDTKDTEKLVEETLDSMKDLLKQFGISKDDFKNAKIKILNNKEAYNELSKIYTAFEDLWN